MIRVSVLYPNEDGAKFDHDYYANTHIPMVRAKLEPGGLKKAEVDKGLAGGDGGTPPFVAAAYLFFDSVDAFQGAFGAHAEEIMGDIPNYTNLQPQVQISEVV